MIYLELGKDKGYWNHVLDPILIHHAPPNQHKLFSNSSLYMPYEPRVQ